MPLYSASLQAVQNLGKIQIPGPKQTINSLSAHVTLNLIDLKRGVDHSAEHFRHESCCTEEMPKKSSRRSVPDYIRRGLRQGLGVGALVAAGYEVVEPFEGAIVLDNDVNYYRKQSRDQLLHSKHCKS